MNSWVWNGGFAYTALKIGSITLHAAKQLTIPTPFQAMLQGDTQFTGTCTDRYGQARIDGQVEGESVQFIKQYTFAVSGASTKNRVQYQGTMTPDRARIEGTWVIHGKCLGVIPMMTYGTWFVLLQ